MSHALRFHFFLIITALLSAPSVLLMPWFAFANPYSLRNFEGFVVEWESYYLLDTASHLLSGIPTGSTADGTDTDSFRALVPILLFSILIAITGFPGLAYQLTDIIFVALCANFLFFLCIHYHLKPTTAYLACILFITGPVSMSFMGGFGLHASHSSSLIIALYLALRYPLIAQQRLRRAFYLSLVFFLSSIMYNYHYLLMPFFILLSLYTHTDIWMSIAAVMLYYAIHYCVDFFLYLFGKPLISHNILNTPIIFIINNFTLLAPTLLSAVSFIQTSLLGYFSQLIYNLRTTILLFTLPISATAVLTAVLWRPPTLLLHFTIMLLITQAQSFVYNSSWTLTATYPYVYMFAAQGIMRCYSYLIPPSTSRCHRPTYHIGLISLSAIIHYFLVSRHWVGDTSYLKLWWAGRFLT